MVGCTSLLLTQPLSSFNPTDHSKIGIPASINRIYGVIRPNNPSFGLNYASSFVFPLQGFWNVIVYVITSRTACKNLWASMRGRGSSLPTRSSRRGFKITSPTQGSFADKARRGRRGKEVYDEEEGMAMEQVGKGSRRVDRPGSQESATPALANRQ